MDLEVVRMHTAFIADAMRRKQELADELAELETVVRFHRREVERHGGRSEQLAANGHQESDKPSAPDLAAMAKHDLAAYALKKLGQRARIPEIAAVLLKDGYGQHLKRQIFVNSLYTAMSRRTDMFRKVGVGVWELIDEKGGDVPSTSA